MTGYVLERRLSPSGDWSVVANITNVTAYQDTGLSSDILYDYRVRAYNAGGYSDYSDIVTIATPKYVPPVVPPLGFSIERKTEGGLWKEIADIRDGKSLAYFSLGLAAGTRYGYRMRAYNAGGYSDYSNEAFATTFPKIVVPIPIIGFQLERRFGQTGDWTLIAVVNEYARTFADINLESDTQYCYRVRAFNISGYSGYSNIACVKTFESEVIDVINVIDVNNVIGSEVDYRVSNIVWLSKFNYNRDAIEYVVLEKAEEGVTDLIQVESLFNGMIFNVYASLDNSFWHVVAEGIMSNQHFINLKSMRSRYIKLEVYGAQKILKYPVYSVEVEEKYIDDKNAKDYAVEYPTALYYPRDAQVTEGGHISSYDVAQAGVGIQEWDRKNDSLADIPLNTSQPNYATQYTKTAYKVFADGSLHTYRSRIAEQNSIVAYVVGIKKISLFRKYPRLVNVEIIEDNFKDNFLIDEKVTTATFDQDGEVVNG